ncbi:MAG: hypothetical protein JRH20_07265 [Deltaproteobacteria bacterium]|nr:hypothetical protein [Deltaproteobacteria bacterium]
MSRRSPWIPILVLFLLALARPSRGTSEDIRVEAAWLPHILDDKSSVAVAPDPSEARLARRVSVSISKRRYGSTLATSVVAAGVRQHHPASVCLKASGLEITSRQEVHDASGCITLLRVRRGADEATVATTYLSHRGETTCSLAKRIASGVWARLRGAESRWTHLQLLDASQARARSRLRLLLNAIQRRNTP